jgi:hypothetical protein
MFKLKPLRKSAEEPLKLSLDTIFECADKKQVREVIFEPQRVEKPTATEGIPMPIVPAGGVVLFVSYKVTDRLEYQLSFGDVVKEALVEQLKKYRREGWRIDFSRTELGEKAVAQRV